MDVEDHIGKAYDFLNRAEFMLEAGEPMLASELLWGAVSQATIAVAKRRGWRYASHAAMKNAARVIYAELEDPVIWCAFALAQKSHANFYHDFMERSEIERAEERVRYFVNRVSALVSDVG